MPFSTCAGVRGPQGSFTITMVTGCWYHQESESCVCHVNCCYVILGGIFRSLKAVLVIWTWTIRFVGILKESKIHVCHLNVGRMICRNPQESESCACHVNLDCMICRSLQEAESCACHHRGICDLQGQCHYDAGLLPRGLIYSNWDDRLLISPRVWQPCSSCESGIMWFNIKKKRRYCMIYRYDAKRNMV